MTTVPVPSGSAVLNYLGWSAEPHLVTKADEHAKQAALVVKAYTRSRGFAEDGTLAEDLAAVVVTYAARSLSNPTSAKEVDAGSFRESPGSPWSFSLVELLVLNGWRRRAA